MSQTLSILEVLDPPENRWLESLQNRKLNLPTGVRVIRFDGEEDDGPDKREFLLVAKATTKKLGGGCP